MTTPTAKHYISEALSSCGVQYILEHLLFSNRAFVLMYHRILNSAENLPYFIQPGMYVSTASFDKHIAFINNKYKIVFLDDLVKKIMAGEDIAGYCAITFDDGWLDNYTEAFPILAKYQAPATIFLATGFMGTNKIFWPEETCYYIDQYITKKTTLSDVPLSLEKFLCEIDKYPNCNKEVYIDKSIEILKKYVPSERNEILTYFRNMSNTRLFSRQIMNWSEAREMLLSGLVRFGSHTENHVILDQVSIQTVKDEIIKSRVEIEKYLGVKVTSFAYPNGNHNEDIRKEVANNGFISAVTTCKGFINSETPLLKIPRIGMHEDVSSTVPLFRSRMLINRF